MINQSLSLLARLINLFNPPPLALMGRAQKVGRAFLVTLTLVVGCILAAMLGAVGVFVVQRGRGMLGSHVEFLAGLEIISAGICVNAICVSVLLQIVKAERKLTAPLETSTQP